MGMEAGKIIHFIQFIYFFGPGMDGSGYLAFLLYYSYIYVHRIMQPPQRLIILFFSTMETNSGNEQACQMSPWRGK